jgi:hypothetical protein
MAANPIRQSVTVCFWLRIFFFCKSAVRLIAGGIAVLGVFLGKEPGFGPQTLRALGIPLVATFASLLALTDRDALMAAIGILGGISGYLFGTKEEKAKPKATEQADGVPKE